jgi:hypothetical protein
MKSVIIHNTIDITNYTITFTLEFILYQNNARIREMPTMNIEQLSAFQIPFVFENLTSGKVIIKNIIVASNNTIITDNFGLQVFCCFNKESLVFTDQPTFMCNTNITYNINQHDNFFITFFIKKVFKRRKLVSTISERSS